MSIPDDSPHHRHLARGFNWLGGAALIAKIIDFFTIIVVLLCLTQAQIGIGSLVVSFGMMIEAFDGLGTGDAIVQASEINDSQLTTLFWYILFIALVISTLALALAPVAQAVYHTPGMALFFVAIAIKQPLVGIAVIPLSLLNRELRYEPIAVINVAATFGAAAVRLVVALLGGGAWALVLSFLASGIFIMLGSLWARPFLPSLRLSLPAIRPLIHFGLRSAAAHISEQVFKNVDYLLVGWFYGAERLGLYRVMFDMAMEPAMAVGSVVNRAALPVFARVAGEPAHFKGAITWSIQRLTTLVAPLMTALILIAVPLTALLHDSHGRSYAAGAVPLEILAGAAILRVISQLLPPLMLATGRPGIAASLSGLTLTALSLGILIAGFLCPPPFGLIAVAIIWFSVYPPLLGWGAYYLVHQWHFRPREFLDPFIKPGLAVTSMVIGSKALLSLPWGALPLYRIAVVLLITCMAYIGLLLHSKRNASLASID